MSHSKNTTVIAFTDSHLQLVQSTASSRGAVISSYSSVGIDNISDNHVSQSLTKLLSGKTSRLKQSTLIGVLPRAPMLVRYLMLPSHQEAELRSMVDLQITKHIPYAREDVIIDLNIVEKESSGYSKVLVIVYPKDIVHRYLKICTMASIAPQILTVGPLGSVNWYLELLKKKIFQDYGTSVLIDVQPSSTEVVFCIHHKFAFARTIKLGALEIANGKSHDLVHQIDQTIAVFLREKLSEKVDQFILIGFKI